MIAARIRVTRQHAGKKQKKQSPKTDGKSKPNLATFLNLS